MTSKLQTLMDTIASHPEIKTRLENFRGKKNEGDQELIDMVTNGLSMLSSIALVLPIGRKGKDLAALVALVSLLMELSVILKREVVDDPEVKRKVADAWGEVEAQSAEIAAGAKALFEKVTERMSSLKMIRS